jgi:hypothetical protein
MILAAKLIAFASEKLKINLHLRLDPWTNKTGRGKNASSSVDP